MVKKMFLTRAKHFFTNTFQVATRLDSVAFTVHREAGSGAWKIWEHYQVRKKKNIEYIS